MIGHMRDKVEFLQAYPDREFNQADFRTFRFFPWAIDSRTWGKIIKADIAGENLLKTRIEGEGYTTKYFIKGKNIIKYLNKYGQLMMSKVRDPKQINEKEKNKEKGGKKNTRTTTAKN